MNKEEVKDFIFNMSTAALAVETEIDKETGEVTFYVNFCPQLDDVGVIEEWIDRRRKWRVLSTDHALNLRGVCNFEKIRGWDLKGGENNEQRNNQ